MITAAPIIQPGELRRLREAARLTQSQLGAIAGFDAAQVGRHERGADRITLRASNAYRYALGRIDPPADAV